MFSVLDESDMSIFASIAHQLCKRRNLYVFERKFEAPETVVKTATQIALEYKEANSIQGSKIKPAASSAQSWSTPPLHVFKANWDASIDKMQCRVGVGVVVRDWNGQVVATLRSQRDLFPDPLLAESIVALKAVILCNQLNMQDIILEGDSLNVVQMIKGEEKNWSCTGMIIQDTRTLLKKMKNWSVMHVSRNFNSIAHCLAKDALKLSEESISLEGVPPCIQHLLI
ncbi:uncharacterized protein LOC122306269 [Carya illinoinensis]|uniref:uncharacterized protein LOC122306269 n=1 Tax=Carya illinoinensis TaxID=32201 RepID=UPI001C718BE9|nr:uncharacterized protein LOC122306269 [Carya illinoinensis]